MIFNKIGIITNEKKDLLFEHTENLINYLAGKKNIEIYKNCDYYEEDICKICNIIIVLGGDGTMLKIVPKASKYNVPVIGINLGRIGFMSEIEADEINLLESLFTGDYEIKYRMMLNVDVMNQSGEVLHAGTALNDAVVSHGVLAKLIEIEVLCDGDGIADYRADGVIVATPTGSTAYSMSAGGPIIDPNIECFCVTPVCPYSLVNRPLIFSSESVLEIKNKNEDTDVYLTIDGQINVKLYENDTVIIRKSGFAAKLITVKKHGFFNVIRDKLSGDFKI